MSEPIYKGATRPAMLLGVPMVPLVILLGAGLLGIFWAAAVVGPWLSLLILAVLVPATLWMRRITATDDQRLLQMGLLARLHHAQRNRRLWRARSYSPTLYRGARDA